MRTLFIHPNLSESTLKLAREICRMKIADTPTPKEDSVILIDSRDQYKTVREKPHYQIVLVSDCIETATAKKGLTVFRPGEIALSLKIADIILKR
jgi:hypothetical protein